MFSQKNGEKEVRLQKLGTLTNIFCTGYAQTENGGFP